MTHVSFFSWQEQMGLLTIHTCGIVQHISLSDSLQNHEDCWHHFLSCLQEFPNIRPRLYGFGFAMLRYVLVVFQFNPKLFYWVEVTLPNCHSHDCGLMQGHRCSVEWGNPQQWHGWKFVVFQVANAQKPFFSDLEPPSSCNTPQRWRSWKPSKMYKYRCELWINTRHTWCHSAVLLS